MQDFAIRTSKGVIRVQLDCTSSQRYYAFSINDSTPIDDRDKIKATPDTHPNSRKIWDLYRETHDGNMVIRSGLGLCGCYENYDPAKGVDTHFPESVTAHVNGCLTIAQSLRMFYPYLLTPDGFQRLELLLKYHDIGENVYHDQPDDGSQDTFEKDQIELSSFIETVMVLPDQIRNCLIKDFIHFQDARYNYSADSSRFKLIQLAKVIDKFEAILSGLCYERFGIIGDLAYKDQHYGQLTSQDRYFINEIGGDSTLVSSWFAHTLHDYHEFYGFPFVLDILRVGVHEVRGQWFSWFDDFCKRHHIPDADIKLPSLLMK